MSSGGRVEKQKRVNLTVAQKLELIRKLGSGASVKKVCEENVKLLYYNVYLQCTGILQSDWIVCMIRCTVLYYFSFFRNIMFDTVY